jgi:hypothetical protein
VRRADPFPAHDLVRAGAFGEKQNDLGPPVMLLRGIAVPDDRLEPLSIGSRNSDGNSPAHAADSHARQVTGIPLGIQPSDFIHFRTSALSARRLHRQEHGAARRERRRLLQQARNLRAVDQGRKRRNQIGDTSEMRGFR